MRALARRARRTTTRGPRAAGGPSRSTASSRGRCPRRAGRRGACAGRAWPRLPSGSAPDQVLGDGLDELGALDERLAPGIIVLRGDVRRDDLLELLALA